MICIVYMIGEHEAKPKVAPHPRPRWDLCDIPGHSQQHGKEV